TIDFCMIDLLLPLLIFFSHADLPYAAMPRPRFTLASLRDPPHGNNDFSSTAQNRQRSQRNVAPGMRAALPSSGISALFPNQLLLPSLRTDLGLVAFLFLVELRKRLAWEHQNRKKWNLRNDVPVTFSVNFW